MTDVTHRHMEWRNGPDTGTSSIAIWNHMLGFPAGTWGWSHPLDPDDLKRCVRLLDEFPEWKERMPEMAHRSRYWAALVEVWDEIVELLAEECPGRRGRAPKCYAKMREALESVRRDDPNVVTLGDVTFTVENNHDRPQVPDAVSRADGCFEPRAVSWETHGPGGRRLREGTLVGCVPANTDIPDRWWGLSKHGTLYRNSTVDRGIVLIKTPTGLVRMMAPHWSKVSP